MLYQNKEENYYMPTDRLYDLAMQYKETKLWKQLYDSELFAVKLSNGELGYCSVMGELGEHIALGLYVGRDGLDSYRILGESDETRNMLAVREAMVSQSCLQCSFENKDALSPGEIKAAQKYAKSHGLTYRGKKAYPQFLKYRPAHFPWPLKDEADEQLLYEALSAALEIAEKLKKDNKRSLGFINDAPYDRTIPLLENAGEGYRLSLTELPERQEVQYPSPIIEDELLIARLKKSKKTSPAWECEVIMFPSPMSEEPADDEGKVLSPENAPFFPYTMLMVDLKSEMVLPNEMIADWDNEAEKLITALGRTMSECGVPAELRVRDERTQRLIAGFAAQIGVKVVLCDDLSLLDEVEEDMLTHFLGGDDQEEDRASQMFDVLMDMDDETLLTMPPEVRQQLQVLDREGILPAELSARFRRLFK